MELRDLRHLVDIVLADAGFPPSDPHSSSFFVIPLSGDHTLGIEWRQKEDELMLFANPGYALSLGDEDEKDDEDTLLNLGADECGRWALHIDGKTALVTLCLHVPLATFGPQQFDAAIEQFRESFLVWVMALEPVPPHAESPVPPSAERTDSLPFSKMEFAVWS